MSQNDLHSTRNLQQHITAREWSQLPPTDYISAFTLTQKAQGAVSFNSNTKRFVNHSAIEHKAESTAVKTSFRLNNPFHKPTIPKIEDLPKGRPLWLSELRKEVPSGANYDIDGQLGSDKVIYKTRGAVFTNGYDKMRKVCDIEGKIKIYNDHSRPTDKGTY